MPPAEPVSTTQPVVPVVVVPTATVESKVVEPNVVESNVTVNVPVNAPVNTNADQPGEPAPELREEVEPKIPVAAGAFTRRIDRAKIESHVPKAGLAAATLQAAATFDNAMWSGERRRELLAYLRGAAVERNAPFTEADAQIVAQLQAGSGTWTDGKLRDETMAVLFATGFSFSHLDATPKEVRLDFYPGELEDLDAWRAVNDEAVKYKMSFRIVSPPPGEGSIYVHVGSAIVAVYRARGGPPTPIQDDGGHIALPTKPGAYKLGPAHAHVTRNWYYSQIPWGAEIRRAGDGFQYRAPNQLAWSWATSHPANTLKEPLESFDFVNLPEVTRNGVTFLIWNKNDFGPIAWNLAWSDLYVHTTPDAENAKVPPNNLTASHGCIHIDPRERDEMVKSGYLAVDIPFVVRRWDEHVLPDPIRRDMLKSTGVASKP